MVSTDFPDPYESHPGRRHIRHHKTLPNGTRVAFPMNLTPTPPPVPAPLPPLPARGRSEVNYERMADPHPTMPLSAGEFGPRLPMPDLHCHYCNTSVRWSNALSRFMPIHPSGGSKCPERPRLIGYRNHSVVREPRDLLGTLLIAVGTVLTAVAVVIWLLA